MGGYSTGTYEELTYAGKSDTITIDTSKTVSISASMVSYDVSGNGIDFYFDINSSNVSLDGLYKYITLQYGTSEDESTWKSTYNTSTYCTYNSTAQKNCYYAWVNCLEAGTNYYGKFTINIRKPGIPNYICSTAVDTGKIYIEPFTVGDGYNGYGVCIENTSVDYQGYFAFVKTDIGFLENSTCSNIFFYLYGYDKDGKQVETDSYGISSYSYRCTSDQTKNMVLCFPLLSDVTAVDVIIDASGLRTSLLESRSERTNVSDTISCPGTFTCEAETDLIYFTGTTDISGIKYASNLTSSPFNYEVKYKVSSDSEWSSGPSWSPNISNNIENWASRLDNVSDNTEYDVQVYRVVKVWNNSTGSYEYLVNDKVYDGTVKTKEKVSYGTYKEVFPDDTLRGLVIDYLNNRYSKGLTDDSIAYNSDLENITSLGNYRSNEETAAVYKLDGIQYLTKLVNLDLDYNEISDVSVFESGCFEKLQYLYLSGNNITKFPDLTKCTALKSCSFGNNKLSNSELAAYKSKLPATWSDDCYISVGGQRTGDITVVTEDTYYIASGIGDNAGKSGIAFLCEVNNMKFFGNVDITAYFDDSMEGYLLDLLNSCTYGAFVSGLEVGSHKVRITKTNSAGTESDIATVTINVSDTYLLEETKSITYINSKSSDSYYSYSIVSMGEIPVAAYLMLGNAIYAETDDSWSSSASTYYLYKKIDSYYYADNYISMDAKYYTFYFNTILKKWGETGKTLTVRVKLDDGSYEDMDCRVEIVGDTVIKNYQREKFSDESTGDFYIYMNTSGTIDTSELIFTATDENDTEKVIEPLSSKRWKDGYLFKFNEKFDSDIDITVSTKAGSTIKNNDIDGCTVSTSIDYDIEYNAVSNELMFFHTGDLSSDTTYKAFIYNDYSDCNESEDNYLASCDLDFSKGKFVKVKPVDKKGKEYDMDADGNQKYIVIKEYIGSRVNRSYESYCSYYDNGQSGYSSAEEDLEDETESSNSEPSDTSDDDITKGYITVTDLMTEGENGGGIYFYSNIGVKNNNAAFDVADFKITVTDKQTDKVMAIAVDEGAYCSEYWNYSGTTMSYCNMFYSEMDISGLSAGEYTATLYVDYNGETYSFSRDFKIYAADSKFLIGDFWGQGTKIYSSADGSDNIVCWFYTNRDPGEDVFSISLIDSEGNKVDDDDYSVGFYDYGESLIEAYITGLTIDAPYYYVSVTDTTLADSVAYKTDGETAYFDSLGCKISVYESGAGRAIGYSTNERGRYNGIYLNGCTFPVTMEIYEMYSNEPAYSVTINEDDCDSYGLYLFDYDIRNYHAADDLCNIVIFDSNDNRSCNLNIYIDTRYEGEVAESDKATIEGYSASIGDSITLKVYALLPDSIKSSTNIYMSYSIGGVKGKATSSSKATVDGKEVYVYEIPVAAKQMTKEITLSLYVDGSLNNTYSMTFSDYLNQVGWENSEYSDLIGAIRNYGAYAQKYFEYNTIELSNMGYSDNVRSVSSSVTDSYLNIGNSYSDYSEAGNGVSFFGASLVCVNETQLKLYFKTDASYDSVEAFTAANKVVCSIAGANTSDAGSGSTGSETVNYTVERAGSNFYAVVIDVPASDLGSTYAVSVGSGVKMYYSPMTYAATVMNRAGADTKLVNLCKALYLYYKAAVGA